MSKVLAWRVEVKYTQEFIDLMAPRDGSEWLEAPTLGQGRPVAGRWQLHTTTDDESWATPPTDIKEYEYRVTPLVAQN